MKWIEMYGGIDGAHHKDWVLDHVARILNGAEITVKQASWENGHKELRFSVSESCEKYDAWVQEMRGEYDEENEEGTVIITPRLRDDLYWMLPLSLRKAMTNTNAVVVIYLWN